MIEVEPWPITIGKNPRFFIKKMTYFLAYIIKGADMISTILSPMQY